MSVRKGLILDANILIRAVFGKRVPEILERFERKASFFSPQVCFEEARRYIPDLCKRRRLDAALALKVLNHVSTLVVPIEHPNDWPVVAVALLMDLPVWTEERDFFGAGVATWTTKTVELYLLKKR